MASRAPVLAVSEAEVESVTPTFEELASRIYEIWRRNGEIQSKDRELWIQAITELASGDEEDDDASHKHGEDPRPFRQKGSAPNDRYHSSNR